jgi:ABC-2 type transport system ATP-binding protein
MALDGLSLHVEKGSVYGLAGVNGAGKTTIIKHLAGILRQDSGEALVGGEAVFDNPSVKAKIGYIPDELYFFPSYTIAGHARLFSRLYEKWSESRLQEILSMFGLDPKLKLGRLSKGMRKQASFAFAMAAQPEALLLDEPLDGLDPVARKRIVGKMMEDVADRGMTVLFSSHNLKDMEGICDSVGIMREGRMSVERGLDDLKGGALKIQAAYPPQIPSGKEKYEGLELVRWERHGSVETFIARESEERLRERLKAFSPLICDVIPLSLEEIFMIEVGGAGDGGIA